MTDVPKHYLKIPGHKGGSKNPLYRGAVEVVSWSLGEARPVGAAGGGASSTDVNSSVSEVVLLIVRDSGTPELMMGSMRGETLDGKVVLDSVVKGQVYLRVTLDECYITSFSAGQAAAHQIPVDELTVNFAGIRFDSYPKP